MQKLKNILLSGSVSASDYLLANPFSKLANEDLNGTITPILFFNTLFVMPLKYYERLAQIYKVSMNVCLNTIFITGFRGAGKTTFANFLSRLINSEAEIRIPEVTKDILSTYSKEDVKNAITTLRTVLGKTTMLDDDDSPWNPNFDELSEEINGYCKIILDGLNGKAVHLDFERGISDDDFPFEQKLNSNLKKLLKRIIDDDIDIRKRVFDLLLSFYETFGLTELEKKDSYHIKEFFEFVEKKLYDVPCHNDIRNELSLRLKPLELDQLLYLIVLIDISYMEVKGDKRKIYYLFDNLDVVYDTKHLNNFIKYYAYFAENISKLLNCISEKKILTRDVNFHCDLCFIFLMRETSTMQIADHFNDRLLQIADHFDISSDIDKSQVIAPKKRLLELMYQNPIEPRPKHMIDSVVNINNIFSDSYIRDNIFTMFNNDYKRAIPCISSLIEDHPKLMIQYFDLMSDGHDFAKHGARGILFRLLFDHFDEMQYFDKIGVRTSLNRTPNITYARLILLYLNSKQYNHSEKFIFDNRDLVSLSSLFTILRPLLGNNDKTATENFLSALEGMYGLRLSKTWNHLVTFDSIKSVSPDELRAIIDKMGFGYKTPIISVRITCAGRNYVRLIASHFEFFACRFVKESKPLFAKANLQYDSSTDRYAFENLIKSVYLAVERCCINLKNLANDVLINEHEFTRESLLDASDYMYVNKYKKYSVHHEERYIHQHIRYIDAYRLFLINTYFTDKVIDINSRIIPLIERYIQLLSDNPLYSDLSKTLVEEFCSCVHYIKDVKKYNNNDVEISRAGAKQVKK